MHLPMSKILAFPGINNDEVSFANLPQYTLFAPSPAPRVLYKCYFWVYLGVRTCELFFSFAPSVFLSSVVLTYLFPLFYFTCEFNRFLHRERAFSSVSPRY